MLFSFYAASIIKADLYQMGYTAQHLQAKNITIPATITVSKKQKKAYQKFLKTKGIGKGVKVK